MFYALLFFMFIWIAEDPHCFELENMNPISFFILIFIVGCLVFAFIGAINEGKNKKDKK